MASLTIRTNTLHRIEVQLIGLSSRPHMGSRSREWVVSTAMCHSSKTLPDERERRQNIDKVLRDDWI